MAIPLLSEMCNDFVTRGSLGGHVPVSDTSYGMRGAHAADSTPASTSLSLIHI